MFLPLNAFVHRGSVAGADFFYPGDEFWCSLGVELCSGSALVSQGTSVFLLQTKVLINSRVGVISPSSAGLLDLLCQYFYLFFVLLIIKQVIFLTCFVILE